jgi:hypothetical protein
MGLGRSEGPGGSVRLRILVLARMFLFFPGAYVTKN